MAQNAAEASAIEYMFSPSRTSRRIRFNLGGRTVARLKTLPLPTGEAAAQSQDPYRRMVERPGFASHVSLVRNLLELCRTQANSSESQLDIVSGLAVAIGEVNCARFDVPGNGRTTATHPQPYIRPVVFRPVIK